MNPLIKAMRQLGGSGTIDEIYEKVIEILGLPEEILLIPHGDRDSGQSEVQAALHYTQRVLEDFYADRVCVEQILETKGRIQADLATSALSESYLFT